MYTFDKTPDYLYPSRVPALIRALFAKSHPRPKIVILLRNPIDRAYSHYRMVQRILREEHVPFEEFIGRELSLLQEWGLLTDFQFNYYDLPASSNTFLNNNNNNNNLQASSSLIADSNKKPSNHSLEELDQLYDQVSDQLQGHNYLSRSMYAMQLERWFRHGLGPDMMILPYAEMALHPAEVYAQVLEFVGMPFHQLSQDLLTKKFNYNSAVTEPLRNSTRSMLAKFFHGANQDLVELLKQYNHSSAAYDWQSLLS